MKDDQIAASPKSVIISQKKLSLNGLFAQTLIIHKPAGDCLIKCAYMVVLVSGVLLKFLSKTALGGNG